MEDNIIEEHVVIGKKMTNAERMVSSMVTLGLSKETDKKTLELLIANMKGTILYSEASIRANIVSNLSATVRVLVSNRMEVVMITTKEEYKVFAYITNDEDFVEVERIVKTNFSLFASKIEMEIELEKLSTLSMEEIGFVQVNLVNKRMVNMDSALEIDITSRKGVWSMTTRVTSLNGFNDEVVCSFRLFTSRITTTFPILSTSAINKIVNPMMKLKMKTIAAENTPVEDLEDHEKVELYKLWMSNSEILDMTSVFREESGNSNLMAMLMGDIHMGFEGALSAFSNVDFAPTGLGMPKTDEEEREMVMDMAMDMHEAAPDSIFAALMKASEANPLEGLTRTAEEVNEEMIKRRTLESMTRGVRSFITNNLEIPVGTIRTTLLNTNRFYTSKGREFNMAFANYDLLKSLKKRMIVIFGEMVSVETFILVSKIFLSMIHKKEEVVNVQIHYEDPLVVF
jgi:hypothetical protein